MLRKIDPELPVELGWFGDKSPLVPTAPGVAEPRNRRAEILIL
jgi:outer membrane protein OmpA-like peptidoglycan-associated protein